MTYLLFRLQVVESSSILVSILFKEALSHPYISFFHLLVNGFSVSYLPPFFIQMTNIGTVTSIIICHCHNVCTIHYKDSKLTSVFLKMSQFILQFTRTALRLRVTYETLMAAQVVAGIVSYLYYNDTAII